MSNATHFMPKFTEGKQGIQIKSENGKEPMYNDEKGGNMSCVYNSQSPTAKTILITNNYSQTSTTNAVHSNSINNSSITIFTHNNSSDSGGESAKNMVPSSPRSTVVVDRINILINNHFNDPSGSVSGGVSGADACHKMNDEKRMCATASSAATANMPTNFKCEKNDKTVDAAGEERVTSTTTTGNDIADKQPDESKCVEENADILCDLNNGDEVLVLKDDGQFHMGTILTPKSDQCLVKFRDDSETWVDTLELTKLDTNDTSLVCIVCKLKNANSTVECCLICGRGYHQSCVDISNGLWYCRR